ncbi:hypothetical protein [Paraburkholderia ferrariae]|uniref:hypothetical protein n=1 Tax=Paraburkholderia ferrariae TaxID=386056 RepID=UPI0012EC19B1|nr:hypothetical protein [Paraburkholderia ferrariae]
MKVRMRQRIRLARMAGLIALASGYAVPGYSQPGGTITFTGAIVAPAFEIAVAQARAATPTTSLAYDSSGEAGPTVRLTAPYGSTPVADIALVAANPARQNNAGVARGVDVKLTNQAGRQIAADATGHYRLDGQGAVMALRPMHESGSPKDKLLVVVLSYN